MAFKIKKILTDKQLFRAKFGLSLAVLCLTVNIGTSYVYGASDDYLKYDGDTFLSTETEFFERGRIVYYSHNEQVCNSPLLVPGTAILPNGLLAVFYGLTLTYLFLGIYVVSDIFMASIERITSQTQIVNVKDRSG